MNLKKATSVLVCAAALMSLLAGCSSADKSAISETAENFLSVVVSGTTENIEKYASDSVTNGSFVKTFDSDYLAQNFKDGFVTAEIDDETSARVDSFCELFSDMVTGYDITDVSVDKDGKGSVIAIINTSFPINIIDNSEALEMIDEAATSYYAENEETINSLYEEKSEEEVEAIVYNDMIIKIIDVYEEIIKSSDPETYAIVLTVEKNAETDSWYVTNVASYDEAATGATAPATDTATTDADAAAALSKS